MQQQILENQLKPCSFCHDIFVMKEGNKVYNHYTKYKCLECNSDYVPEIIISTMDPPEGISIIGAPKFIEVSTTRSKLNLKHEKNAVQINEHMFFIEYQLHSQLINKMKFIGKNSIFALRISVHITNETIIGTAVGTAFTLKALPLPVPIDFKINKYFKHREDLSKLDVIKPFLQMAARNIEVNFRMPVFKLVSL